MSSEPKFKVGDYIKWDRILWLVVNVENNIYELKLVNPSQFNTRHGNGGYMDSNEIDKTATLVETVSKVGGSKRSGKKRRSRNRRRISTRRQ